MIGSRAPARPRNQFAALPWRDGPHGREVLLITTRGGRRWLVPKGKPMPGLSAAEAAAQEAWEEAGVTGTIEAVPLGSFAHRKGSLLAPRRLQVELYALEVTAEADDWPEAHERERRWVSVPTALRLVRSAELRRLITEFCAFRPGKRMRLAALLHRLATPSAGLRR
jgi:8-oxo-dGTP pyrophosphatase MutT (NUDIX family)